VPATYRRGSFSALLLTPKNNLAPLHDLMLLTTLNRSPRARARNPVMVRALAVRPTQQSVEQAHAQCPLCAAPGNRLRLETVRPSRVQPFPLALLGLACARWVRNKVQVVCQDCDCRFCGAAQFSWNYAVAMRRFADFGLTKTPLPARRRTRNDLTLFDTVRANLAPGKQALVSQRKSAGLFSRRQRRARCEQARRWRAACAAHLD
jgi:hypothetical protein